jgi:Putative prokaryotic signal transducing protein
MPAENWVVLETVGGSFQAEILRGLLEAQGVPVVLSQEGAGHSAYAVTVGPLGEVQILVPAEELSNARKVLDDYYSGAFEDLPPLDDGVTPEDDTEVE